MALRGRFCRTAGAGAGEPARRLLAAVVLRAVKDARGGDFAAAAWLDDRRLAAWLSDELGVRLREWRGADWRRAHVTPVAERERRARRRAAVRNNTAGGSNGHI